MNRIALTLAAAALVSSTSFAQVPGNLFGSSHPRSVVEVYTPKDSPIEVTSWGMSEDDLLENAKVVNHSRMTVQSITFRWYATTPAECMTDGVKRADASGLIGPVEAKIAPGSSIFLKNLGIKTKSVTALGDRQHRLVIGFQVIPVHISFVEASSWDRPLNPNAIYDPTSQKSLRINCSGNRLIPSPDLNAFHIYSTKCEQSRSEKITRTSFSAKPTPLFVQSCGDPDPYRLNKCYTTTNIDGEEICVISHCTKSDIASGQCTGEICELD